MSVCEAITESVFKEWLFLFQAQIQSLAQIEGLTARDYACTLLGGVLAESWARFFQIGDGAIVVLGDPEPNQSGDQYNWIFWPNRGEYANTTYFATDSNAAEQVQFESIERNVQELAIFTDGLQPIALHNETQSAHSPFFRPFFSELRKRNAGHSVELTKHLQAFLLSERVTQRTDDDKTLIIASRLSAT